MGTLCGVVALLPDHPPRHFEWRGTSHRVVAGDILYTAPPATHLQDVDSAIREKVTIFALCLCRKLFLARNLKSPNEMERRFAGYPLAFHANLDIAGQCDFDLGKIQYRYPYEKVIAGRTAITISDYDL